MQNIKILLGNKLLLLLMPIAKFDTLQYSLSTHPYYIYVCIYMEERERDAVDPTFSLIGSLISPLPLDPLSLRFLYASVLNRFCSSNQRADFLFQLLHKFRWEFHLYFISPLSSFQSIHLITFSLASISNSKF